MRLVDLPASLVRHTSGKWYLVWGRNRATIVEWLDTWRESGEWWEQPDYKPAERDAARLLLEGERVVEISRDARLEAATGRERWLGPCRIDAWWD